MSEAGTLLRLNDVKQYWDALFSNVKFTIDDFICIRGIGEKGTKNDKFRQDLFFQPAIDNSVEVLQYHVERFATTDTAAFILPCVLKNNKGTSENVKLFTSVVVDFDDGDTAQKIDYLAEHLGKPSMLVASGGLTKDNKAKCHVYYILNEPTDNIGLVVKLRDQIARKCGGDPQFGLGVASNPYGRAHQPIRIGGSVHGKNAIYNSCQILYCGEERFFLSDLEAKIEKMQRAPYLPAEVVEEKSDSMGSMFSSARSKGITTELTDEVHEGGQEKTRFSVFSQVAGHYIHCIRDGKSTLDEAFNGMMGWVKSKMVPPWDDDRTKLEFRAILAKDISENGPLPEKEVPVIPHNEPLGLKKWAAHRWIKHPKPVHEFLVDKTLIKGEPTLFVAEGGCGKTGLIIDQAMKISSYQEGDNETWCGKKILGGGTCVVILNEDSMREIQIRSLDIDTKNMIKKAGDKLIIMPMTACGGSFPLVDRDFRSGVTRSSQKWNDLMARFKNIPDLACVYIDTLSSVSHGDENHVQSVTEMLREALRVPGETGASLVFAHHVRKSKDMIKNLQELAAEVRGSSAISNSMRCIWGIYACPDYIRRMQAMGLTPERGMLWNFGICKGNIHGLDRSLTTLLRNDKGLLIDVTELDQFAHVDISEREAWLVHAIKVASEMGHPFKRSKRSANGISNRRSELPEILKKVGEGEFAVLVENLLQDKKIFLCSKKENGAKDLLDVEGGALTSNDYTVAESNAGAFNPPKWEKDYIYSPNLKKIVKNDHYGGMQF